MIFNFWRRISYIVQLLAACMIFMVPVRKKTHYLLRVGLAALFLICLSYGVNTMEYELSHGYVGVLYWASYILLCIGFVRIGLDSNLLQAIYCGICACSVQHIAYDICMIYQIIWERNAIVSALVFLAVYVSAYWFIARKLPERDEFAVNRRAILPIVTIILLVWILSILESSAIAGFEAGIWHRVIYRLVDGLCCVYILWGQINQKENIGLQRELNGINAAWRLQKKQYEVTSETIESINRKCHDLKHQIRMLQDMTDEHQKAEFLDEIENDIMIYDTAVHTGNKALDIVMMEKGLFCSTHGIQWSCMADGSKLGFMKMEDIYAIFGNALDNAIAAVLHLKDAEKRIISVKIIVQGSLLVIQIQNYYDGDLCFENGLPMTTKKNKQEHGYGMKSIRYTAEKYNGVITVQAENQIFMLQVLIPVI